MMRFYFLIAILSVIVLLSYRFRDSPNNIKKGFRIEQDTKTGTISIFRSDAKVPVLVQHAKANFRPYLTPAATPDGNNILTEFVSANEKQQVGIFWGFTSVNGRD